MIDLNDLVGKPFNEDGYGPDSYSCYGLAVEVFKRFGISIPKTNISVCACKEVSQLEIKSHVEKYWKITEELIPPTIVLIKSLHPDYADHIGVYIGKDRMIHITKSTNAVIDRISKWKHKIIGYYSYANPC